ncbi:hypothetical protein [Polyangium sp. y55x31]|uniref:hypothetical protein n=1 Tax=Polyangium sp. y55x31 TaxID=3042688 RepID=UPI002482A0AE|nr:hypothetical protein [Polyangium sp. y55x31]MDI1484179.1 hypothetical protein [Polyangium sp. y55x31]
MQKRIHGLEELSRRVWGDKIPLALAAHALGGIGLGMLTCKGTDARHRRVAYALVGFSMLAHVYAFTTMRVGEQESGG